MSGKGDRPRPVDKAKYEENFDRIFKQGKYSDAEKQTASIPDKEPVEQCSTHPAESESPADGSETE